MKSTKIQYVVRQALCLAAVPFLAAGLLVAQQQPGFPPQAGSQAGPQGPAPLLPPQQLETLVAPVALYPDNLLGQIMAASTYPLEIAEAAQWLQQNPGLQGPQLVDAARQQNWDPSVQALVVFPDVLTRLASDIRWTTDLGNAFLAQQADVMAAVQRMRARAQSAGKLRSNAQQTVTTEMDGDQSAIDIQPANPEMVYVPYYNPQYIWGPPVYGYYPPWDYADIGFGFGFGYGPGIYIGGFFGGLGWGGWGWGCNWFHHGIFLNAGFFGRYGFGGRGFVGGGFWAHDPGHRLGIAYPNRALNGRYGAASIASARTNYATSPYRTPARTTGGSSGGWSRFGQTPSHNGGGNAYHAAPSSGGNFGRSGATSGYRSSPSYGGNFGRSGATPGYRSSPSYGGGAGGYHPSPSYRGGTAGGSHPSGGGSSHVSGGGGSSHGGGGGGSHVGGGGGGGHSGGGHR